MKKIAIVTATRAEYGDLFPLIKKVDEDDQLELELIVTGGHLTEKQGYTIDEVKRDGFHISHEIPITEEDNTPYGISVTMANAIKSFAECFHNERPDMVIILGDRTEMLGIAAAAMNERIPIAHIHGGEVTEGAVDDCVRHALTKMSYLHFVSTDVYRKRVIQLGENPARVYNVGSLSTDNILHMELWEKAKFRKDVGIPESMPFVVVTFHPVTLEDNSIADQVRQLCSAMQQRPNYFYLITKANTDVGGNTANALFEEFCAATPNTVLVSSLGKVRYLSAVKYADFVLGNSSSGIGEAPVLGTPTVNVGDRQKGREMGKTIVCCEPKTNSILCAMDQAEVMPHIPSLMYGDGQTASKIVNIIKEFLFSGNIDLKKGFFDLDFESAEQRKENYE